MLNKTDTKIGVIPGIQPTRGSEFAARFLRIPSLAKAIEDNSAGTAVASFVDRVGLKGFGKIHE